MPVFCCGPAQREDGIWIGQTVTEQIGKYLTKSCLLYTSSGLIAAHSILAAQGDYSGSRLELYRELLNDRLRQKRNALESLARFIPQSVREICGRTLLRSHSFCRNVVCDRWFLRVDERPLAFASEIVSPAAATIAQ